MSVHFSTLRQQANKAKSVSPYVGSILAFDPGETTGYAFFQSTRDAATLVYQGELETWPLDKALPQISGLISNLKPGLVIHESYRVYEWKAETHSWSDVPTLQLIGSIKTLCLQNNVPFAEQSAQMAKSFCTDDKLKNWGMYIPGKRHSRDAIRHGCRYLLFGPTDQA